MTERELRAIKAKNIRAKLAELGIYNEAQLAEAIKNLPPLDITCFVADFKPSKNSSTTA